ncbi:glycosyltransferase 87 family protein [Eubacterium sp.]|uniref:glycosyltransferase 87 family protein n=1 Tax=Eubacterium sp. TaxID=142586 RepID=UPI003EFE7BD3
MKKKSIDLLIVYDIIAGLLLLISTALILSNNSLLPKFLDSDIGALFSDFAFHINSTADLQNIYHHSMHTCFPPFIYLFYRLLYLIIPKGYEGVEYYNFLYAIYTAALFALFAIAVKEVLKTKKSYAVNIAIVFIVLSNSFVYGIIEQANIVLICSILMLFAVAWKDSENKLKRELALIFIAICAAIKVYPAIFGLIYVIEKKYKQAFRLVIYGVLFFFVPFIFTGGIDGIVTFFKNQMAVHTGWGANSVVSLYSFLVYLDFSRKFALVADAVLLVVLIAFSFICKEKWKRYYLLISVMLLCPLWSGRYTICMILVPFLVFIIEEKSVTLYSIIYTVLFSLLFCSDIAPYIPTVKYTIVLIFLAFLIIVQEIFTLAKTKKLKNMQN